MIQSVLCALGFHRWGTSGRKGAYQYRCCSHCPTRQGRNDLPWRQDGVWRHE